MGQKLKPLRNKEIIKILTKNGFIEKSADTSSRHFNYYKKDDSGKDRLVQVSKNPSAYPPPGTLMSIIRNSGLSKEGFYNSLSKRRFKKSRNR